MSAIRVSSQIGVPDEEREIPQTLEIDVSLFPSDQLVDLADDIEKTINYYEVWLLVRKLACERPRQLIETLAEELAEAILAAHRLDTVEITVRKFILPDTGSVSVSIRRERGNS
ncbi:MAG: dihydroneopterin aldolase [Verrucomicrobiota bacterium]